MTCGISILCRKIWMECNFHSHSLPRSNQKFQFSRPAGLEFVCVSQTNCKIPLYVYGRVISPFTAITKEHTKEHTIQIDIFTLGIPTS